jgi:cyclohexa-1,5-dienecarbonyl-CoA hydratase
MLKTEERGGALWVSLDRPPLNILDTEVILKIRETLEALASRRDLKVLVLRSAVPGTFSAGVEIRDHTRERVVPMLESFHAVFRALDGLPQVSVATVDGRCLGGGCELAASCDILLATPRSTFGQPEIDLGCFPPVAAALFPQLLGRGAAEMILLGTPVSAAEAARLGLVTRVVETLEGETDLLVSRLAGKSGAVLALARRALRSSARFQEALASTERLYVELLGTIDMEEGVRAFLEKRKPRWTDS